jgi:hypothetical protein
MVCRECGSESSDEFSFCPHCGKQRNAKYVCGGCGREFAENFKFCPHCGKAFAPAPSVIESPSPLPEVERAAEGPIDQPTPATNGPIDSANKIGTYVFGSFSALALLVSIIKGIVPIYLIESAIWAGAAWYWHSKKTHSELAKAIVIVLAALIAIGEVIQVARQFNKPSTVPVYQSSDPFEKYAVPEGSSSAPAYSPSGAADGNQTGASAAVDVADIERQAVALYKQKRYADARPLFDKACNDGEMGACNSLAYLFARGLGGAHDTKMARGLYQKACDQGTLSSCASLGSLYQDAGDAETARKNFEKACTGGVTEACDLLHGLK